MTTVEEPADTTQHADHADHGEHDQQDGAHEHVTDKRYIVLALFLAVVTAAEVAASYIDLGPIFIPLLLGLMVIKFFVVASFFMHLRFDNRIFTWMFYAGLFLAVGVYVAALMTFQFFDS